MLREARTYFGITALLLLVTMGRACWQESAGFVAAQTTYAEGPRDGQRDFDFFLGKWHVHNRRLMHPLTGSQDWIEFDGTTIARKFWDGHANVDEYEADTPSGRIEGMSVEMYNPQADAWSEYWANSTNGAFTLPAAVGRFANGRGQLFDHEEMNGKHVLVRYLWENQPPRHCRWEQAYSVDEGKTWETNWTMDFTRVEGLPL